MYRIRLTKLSKQIKFFSSNNLAVAQSKALAWRKQYKDQPEIIFHLNFKELGQKNVVVEK